MFCCNPPDGGIDPELNRHRQIGTDFIRRLDPAFDARPPYVLFCAEIPQHLRLRDSDGRVTLAYFCCLLDIRMRTHLQDAGLWRGRGGAIAICAHAVDALDEDLASLLVHEAAHAAEAWHRCPALFVEKPMHDWKESDWGQFSRYCDTPCREKKWANHDHQFVRAGLHLARRAQRMGLRTDFETVGLTTAYINRHENEFAWTLRDELVEMADWPINDILATDAPTEFMELWQEATNVPDPV